MRPLRVLGVVVAVALVGGAALWRARPAGPSLEALSALANDGDPATAEAAVGKALAAHAGPEPKLRLLHATALRREGRNAEAFDEAKRAAELGEGRDATILAGALAILLQRFEEARALLAPWKQAHPDDADATYDLALVADSLGQYGPAREGYLASLKLDPKRFDARYNLVMLTFRAGAKDEARHHLAKLAELAPGDPRVAEAAKRIGEADFAKPQGEAPATP